MFELSCDEITDTQAVISWVLPESVVIDDVYQFKLHLFKDGTYKNITELNKASTGPLVFEDFIN